MAANVEVRAPQDAGGAPYLSQETLAELAAVRERLNRLWEGGRLGPEPSLTPPPAPTPQETRAVSLGGARRYRSAAEWATVEEELREAVRQARQQDRGPVPVREVYAQRAAGLHARELLTAAGFALPSGRLVRLSEAYGTDEFPVLLRAGLRTILFSSFSEEPTTYDQICESVDSNKEAEVWLELSRLGTFGAVGQGEEYPQQAVVMLPTRRVANAKYGAIIPIPEEMLKFDQTNQIRQIAADRGAAARQTLEEGFYSVMRTGGNYTRTSADNLIGNNTGTTAWTPGNLSTVYETLRTMKEPRSGRFLGVRPDTLVCGVGCYFPSLQLFRSRTLASGEDGTTSKTPGGVGTDNPFFSMGIRNIIESPQLARYEFLMGQLKRGAVYQEVEGLTLAEEASASSGGEAFSRDVWRYRARVWFGFGLRDDRYWYYSDSTTAPVWV